MRILKKPAFIAGLTILGCGGQAAFSVRRSAYRDKGRVKIRPTMFRKAYLYTTFDFANKSNFSDADLRRYPPLSVTDVCKTTSSVSSTPDRSRVLRPQISSQQVRSPNLQHEHLLVLPSQSERLYEIRSGVHPTQLL